MTSIDSMLPDGFPIYEFTVAFEKNVLWVGVATLASPFLPGIEQMRLATPFGEQRVVAPEWTGQPIGLLAWAGMLAARAVVIALLRRGTRHSDPQHANDFPITWPLLVGTLMVGVGFVLFGMSPLSLMLSWPFGCFLGFVAQAATRPSLELFKVRGWAVLTFLMIGATSSSLKEWAVSAALAA